MLADIATSLISLIVSKRSSYQYSKVQYISKLK
jgi:hypothetical protein